jgi:hypothetical protein
MKTSRQHVVWLLLWSCLHVLPIAPCAAADEAVSDTRDVNRWAVDAARDGLRDSNNYPWYDAAEDELRQIEFTPPTPPPEAQDWELNLPDWQPQQRNWNWNISFWEGVQWIVSGLLVILLVGALVLLLRVIWRRDRLSNASLAESRQQALATEAEQIENLPFPVERPKTDLLSEARRNYENGSYGEAMAYLFSYQLVHLDKHHLIRLAKGKTNRQYMKELHGGHRLRGMLRHTMIAFEDFFFGNHAIDRKRFELCWQDLDDFHKTVQELMPSA